MKVHLSLGVIRKCRKGDRDPKRPKSAQKVCLYGRKDRRLLGRHPNVNSAIRQERAIMIRKRGG